MSRKVYKNCTYISYGFLEGGVGADPEGVDEARLARLEVVLAHVLVVVPAEDARRGASPDSATQADHISAAHLWRRKVSCYLFPRSTG